MLYTTAMRKIALKRPLLILASLPFAAGVLYWQQNYRIVPDYAPPAAPLVGKPVDSITVVAVGDISCSPKSDNYNGGDGNHQGCHMKHTAQLARSMQPKALLLLGDLQYEDGTLEHFKQAYAKSWGAEDLLAISKPAPGNHEYNTPKATGYYEYFGALAGDPAKGYYSYDLGGWHFIALNSNCKDVACDENSEQLKWLKADIASGSQRCTAAYYHHPLHSSGSHGGNTFMKPIYDELTRGAVDVVLAGHDHLYERFAPQDGSAVGSRQAPRSFIVGTGGKDRYPFRSTEPNSEVRISSAFGVLRLQLQPSYYSWEFIDEDGKLLDSGSDRCH